MRFGELQLRDGVIRQAFPRGRRQGNKQERGGGERRQKRAATKG
jgi:hypothetical protein